MGRRSQGQRHLFYQFHLDEAVPEDHLVRKVDAVLDLSWVHAELAPSLLPGRPPFDRPGVDDPDVDRRLRVRHPIGATALPGGSSQPRVSVVLRLGLGRSDPRSLGLLTRAQRALSRE